MKKLLSALLVLSVLLATFNTVVFAADEISTFGISMSGFKGGAKESDVTFSLSDDRLEINQVSWVGTMTEDGTFKNQKVYNVFVTVKIKSGLDAKFLKELSVNDLQYSGINKANKATMQATLKVFKLAFEVKASETGEYIPKAEEDALEHKHCYCGGYIENTGDHTSHSEVTYNKWPGEKAIKYTNGVAYIYLDKDVLLDNTLNIGGGKTIYLCLNGHALAMKYRGQRVINVGVGGTLYLCNCTREQSGQITRGEAEYGAGIHNNGTVRMYGGLITKNNGGYGGGVYNNVNFYLYGGDIYDNKAIHGGGVWNQNDAAFEMYNGTVSLNVASAGGGIYNNGANLVLKGGTIDENVAGSGGGVWNNGGKMKLDGSFILANFARYGGGVWNNGGGLLEIKSGSISKNIASTDPEQIDGYGGGVWNNGDGIISMTGGEITFNKAAFGGGVWCNPDSDFLMSNGVIAENEAEYGGGVYVSTKGSNVATFQTPPPPGKFILSDRAGILMNIAYQKGGGAYVEGILEITGDTDIDLNVCEADPVSSQTYKDTGGQITINEPMPTAFADVDRDAYYLEPVKWAVEKNVTIGTSDVTFSPDDTCNTAQILTFLWRAAGSPTVTNPFPYADVYESDYFYMAAQWAKKKGMIEHYALYPNFDCNRQGAVYYIWCAAGKPACKTQLKFTDIKSTGDSYEAIAWAVDNGITNGTSDTTFSPGKTCTRAQIVTFLWRAAQKGLI